MEIWQTILTAVLTTILGSIATDIIVRLKTTGKKAMERKKAEHLAEITIAVEAVVDPMKAEMKAETASIKKTIAEIRTEDIDVLKKANRDSLRCQLYEIYDRCTIYKTKDDIDNESELFDSYKKLNGNHGCDARHSRFEKLETEDEYLYKANHAKKEN